VSTTTSQTIYGANLPEDDVDVVLSAHFLEHLYRRQANFPSTRFYKFLPQIMTLGRGYPNQDCMVVVGESKVVFQLDQRSGRRARLIFKTVMPAHYKHNVFKKAKTVSLGKIT